MSFSAAALEVWKKWCEVCENCLKNRLFLPLKITKLRNVVGFFGHFFSQQHHLLVRFCKQFYHRCTFKFTKTIVAHMADVWRLSPSLWFDPRVVYLCASVTMPVFCVFEPRRRNGRAAVCLDDVKAKCLFRVKQTYECSCRRVRVRSSNLLVSWL